MGIHVAAVGSDGDEAVRMLQSQMPRPGSAHGHAAQYDSVAVDAIIAARGFDGFKDIRLPSPAVAVLHPAERVQLDVVRVRCGLSGVAFIEPRDELQLTHPNW